MPMSLLTLRGLVLIEIRDEAGKLRQVIQREREHATPIVIQYRLGVKLTTFCDDGSCKGKTSLTSVQVKTNKMLPNNLDISEC